jgi:hypothetical protein
MPRPVKDGSQRVGGRTVQVSSVAKPFFPDALLVKGDLLAYYRDVAEVMLPYLAGAAAQPAVFRDRPCCDRQLYPLRWARLASSGVGLRLSAPVVDRLGGSLVIPLVPLP